MAPLPNFPTAWVSGAGPTGCLAALALARAGWQVSLQNPASAAALQHRSRAYALTHSSQALLQQLGLWEALAPHWQAFDRLELIDCSSAKQVSFLGIGPTQGPGRGAVGWILNHAPLMEVLLAACHQQPGLELLLGQAASASEAHQRQLTVIAEGGRSPSRERLGIPFWGWRYQQACLTAQVQLEGNGDHTAWELFRPEGPLAVLPLGKGLAQVVWSAPQERCNQRAALPEAAFLEALTAVLPSGLKALALRDQPASFPLEWRLAGRLGQGQQLLCGESGHRCHPVGGQGLNLCWRDVAVLAQEAAAVSNGRQSVRQLVRRYGRRRWPDLLATSVATDLLVRLFSNRQPVLMALRSLALGLLGRSGPLRQGVLQLATYGLGPRSLDKKGVNPE